MPALLREKLCVSVVLHSLPKNRAVKIKNNNMCVVLNVSYFACEKPSVAECFNSPLPHSRTTQLRPTEKEDVMSFAASGLLREP